jgi:predicted RNase H-like nuclease (RuvC/YqgF family)
VKGMCFEIERIEAPKKPTDEAIKELSIKLTAAEKEIDGLRGENDQLHKDLNKKINQNYHNGYLIENQKKIIEDLGKTLERYEKENKAMRALLQLWV